MIIQMGEISLWLLPLISHIFVVDFLLIHVNLFNMLESFTDNYCLLLWLFRHPPFSFLLHFALDCLLESLAGLAFEVVGLSDIGAQLLQLTSMVIESVKLSQ